ncbi:hypothetical protein V1264_019851 [Littorina saxatilis]|uniref:Uncharacterized protein n=1 Tax=Littorina saxatilis TaxID=31220 RepID=A0AAN9B8U1_9CAEN
MARYDSPQRLSYRAKDWEWEGWIEEYSRFRRATKLHKEDGDVQRGSLLYSMGTQQAVQILKTFRWEEEEDTDYDLLVKKFSEYFLPKRNLIHDRSLSPADASGRSHFTHFPHGVLRRNRKNMQKVPQTIYTIPPDPETDLPEETETQEQETLTGTENPTPQPPVQNVSRYGRIIKQPARYIEEH